VNDISNIISEVVKEAATERVKAKLAETGDTLTQYAKRSGRFAKDDLIETEARRIMKALVGMVAQ